MLDWTVESSYPQPKQLSAEGWAWEFLRRNLQYRSDYARLATLEAKYGPISKWTKALLKNDPGAWCYTPSKLPDETDQHWQLRVSGSGNEEPKKQLIHEGYGQRWGLIAMFAPNLGMSQGVRFLPRVKCPPVWYSVDDVEGRVLGNPGDPIPREAYTKIDLERPIAPQVAQLRKLLITEQRYFRKFGLGWRTTRPVKKWPRYLRVWDAYEAPADTKWIAEELFPELDNCDPDYKGQSAVRKAYKQADRLVRGGYLKILDSVPG